MINFGLGRRVLLAILVLTAGSLVGQGLPNPVAKSFNLPHGCDGEIRVVKRLNANEIIVGGQFNTCGLSRARSIAIYDEMSSTWRPLGSESLVGFVQFASPEVNSIAVDGGRIYIAGRFSAAGQLSSRNIAYFESGVWHSMGDGLTKEDPTFSWVNEIRIHNGTVFAGGAFERSGGLAVDNISMWDGEAWLPMGAGVDGEVNALEIHDGELIIGGNFDFSGAISVSNVALWDGVNISPVGSGLSATVNALTSIGGRAYAAVFTSDRVMEWDGLSWESISGLTDTPNAFAAMGGELFAVGTFANFDSSVVRLVGNAWHSLSVTPQPTVLNIFADGDDLLVVGSFDSVSSTVANGVAKLSGEEWASLGPFGGLGVTPSISDLASFDGRIYAVGALQSAGREVVNGAAKLEGSRWQPLGEPGRGNYSVVEAADSGVFVGGSFDEIGGISASNVAKFDGSEWTALHDDGLLGVDGRVRAISLTPFGVIVGGSFSQAGQVVADNIALWNGSSWERLGAGVSADVKAIAHSPDAIYVGGEFIEAGGEPAPYIAKYDAGAWSPLLDAGGLGLNGPVSTIYFVDGCVLAGGSFTQAGSYSAGGIAKWCNGQWLEFGPDLSVFSSVTVRSIAQVADVFFFLGRFVSASDGSVSRVIRTTKDELLEFPEVTGLSFWILETIESLDEHVYLAGTFTVFGDWPSVNIARYHEQSDFIFISGFESPK